MTQPKGRIHGQTDYALAEFVGRLKTEIEFFAASQSLLASEVTPWVATLLHASQGRSVLGPVPNLPNLRSPRAERGKAAVAVAHSARHGAQGHSAPSRKGKTSAIQAYWQRMTPKQRSNEMARRKAKWSKEAVDRWAHKKPAA